MPETDNLAWRAFRVDMMLETGLPLEYFDNLGAQDVGDIMGFLTGKSKASKKSQNKNTASKGGR